jgi:predicted negative regulator of RcsB-dependent stress response
VLEGAVDEAVRNEAAFRLARIHFQKGQLDDALEALARIKGTVPEEIKGDLEFLRANVYMATGQPGQAVKVLAQLKSNERLAGFVAYNLGIALLQDGRPQEAVEQLDKAGQLPAGDPAGLAIRDKSSGPDSHWTASILRDRSRTRLCCGRAGPAPRRSCTIARSCRGTSL